MHEHLHQCTFQLRGNHQPDLHELEGIHLWNVKGLGREEEE